MKQQHFNSTDWHKQHNKRVSQFHRTANSWNKEHNERVAELHKSHVLKIERGENGNGLLAKWERFIYNKGKALLKVVK